MPPSNATLADLNLVVSILKSRDNIFKKVWKDAYTVSEYRAIYSAELKFIKRVENTKNTNLNDLTIWFKENINSSWKITIDIGIHYDNMCDCIYDNYTVYFSNENDYVLYTLTWL